MKIDLDENQLYNPLQLTKMSNIVKNILLLSRYRERRFEVLLVIKDGLNGCVYGYV